MLENPLPWYDSNWLHCYRVALNTIERKHPARLEDFKNTLKRFETPRDFEVREISGLLSCDVLMETVEAVKKLKIEQLEMHEIDNFGRFVVHGHEYFTRLQEAFVPLVSEAVGEAVECSYNFLSMYFKTGVCPLHMDAPSAKWTLDICLEQSAEWPIYISPVTGWPDGSQAFEDGWPARVKENNIFKPYLMRPGNGIVFSGSSQWHYRNPFATQGDEDFCHLIFFHYIPKGTTRLASPENWPEFFELPDLFLE